MELNRFPPNDIISLVGEAPRYDLGESVGPDLRLARLLDASGEGLAEMALGYATGPGDPELRLAIAEAHGVEPDDVVITVGGQHALFLTAFILCGRGDTAVTTSSQFPLARNVLDLAGAEVRTVPLSFDRGYQVDAAEVRRTLSPSTRLVSLSSPHNPSGVAIPPEAQREILAAMAETCPEAYLLVDEEYREAAYGDDPVAPSAVTASPRVISVASLSKCHGAPGLRLGWAITRDHSLRDQLILGKFHTVVSSSSVSEALALRVLRQREAILAERRQRLAEGVSRTAAWVETHQEYVEWVRPDAGAICCLRLRNAVFDDARVSRFYAQLAEQGVRVSHGDWFGDEARVFRLGFGLLSMPDLDLALRGLGAALRLTAGAER